MSDSHPDVSLPFHVSVLFDRSYDTSGLALSPPDSFEDLQLSRFFKACIAEREKYNLLSLYYTPLRDPNTVRYRQDVMRDLEDPVCLTTIRTFSEQMRHIRGTLETIGRIEYHYFKRGWELDAIASYCASVRSLANGLASAGLRSRALKVLRDHLESYLASPAFLEMAEDAQALRLRLGNICYAVHIRGLRISVTDYEGEPDYSAEIEETFARFKRGATKDYRSRFPELGMDHVQAQILDRVAKLNPEVFAQLDEYCSRHESFVDETLRIFDQEIQFYLGYLDATGSVRRAGLPFTIPEIVTGESDVAIEKSFDIVLAADLVKEERTVVLNGFNLKAPERLIVVTGPNQGGKTTFARLFGQVHYLASIGLDVPGEVSRLSLPDQIFTHFEREESLETLRGKLEDELIRVHYIIQRATDESIVILNETFNSTTLDDSLLLGKHIVEQLGAIGARGVYVTFVDELSSLNDSVVSMVASVDPDNPVVRTLEIVRKPADGLAYAEAIANKYELGYETLKKRLAS